MGWCGYDIMDGDTPIECEGELIEYLFFGDGRQEGDDEDEMCDLIREGAYNTLRSPINSIDTLISIQNGELCEHEPDIAIQVLGEMIMSSGHPFPTQVRETCIQITQNEIDNLEGQGWTSNEERKRCLMDYITRVREYDVCG